MKSFIFYFVLATLILNIYTKADRLTANQLKKLLFINAECKQDSKVTIRELTDILRRQVSNSPEMKKHLGCVAGRVNFVKDNGEFNKEFLRQILKTSTHKDKAEEVIQACAIKKSSKEETGYNLIKCMIAEKGIDFLVSDPTE